MSGLTNLSIEESYDISKKVLDGINPRYSNIFNQYLSNGNIKVKDFIYGYEETIKLISSNKFSM